MLGQRGGGAGPRFSRIKLTGAMVWAHFYEGDELVLGDDKGDSLTLLNRTPGLIIGPMLLSFEGEAITLCHANIHCEVHISLFEVV